MPLIPFGEWRPDNSDINGANSKTLTNVFPRGDGYGPAPSLLAYTSAMPAACRGFFYGRLTDGTVQVFAATIDRLYTLNNTTQTWTPCSKHATVTSITNASPGVVNYTAHGYLAGDPVVFGGTVLPAEIVAGTVYFVHATGLTANAFSVSATSGGARINTSGGSGTPTVTAIYSSLAATAQTRFVQFNNLVIACHVGIAPQVFTLGSSSAFVDLAGSPPNAAYVSVVNRFVVLTGLATSSAYRVQWSGLNSVNVSGSYTPGTAQSDYQDLSDGGLTRGVAGSDTSCVIFQDTAIRLMTYAPGSPYIFSIQRIASDDGLIAPYSLVSVSDRIFFLSPTGFKMLAGTQITPIGKERVDRTFFADWDSSAPQLMMGAADPRGTRVSWAYKSVNGSTGFSDKLITYDYMLDRWTTANVTTEFLASLARPGVTLEGVDAAYGANIDTLTLDSLDSISNAAYSAFSGVDSAHSLGFFSGPNLEATLQTPEQGGDGTRFYVRGFRPISDAATVYGAVSYRELQSATPTLGSETLVNAVGSCPQRRSTRFARANVRIPAATTWTYISGIEPDFSPEGTR